MQIRARLNSRCHGVRKRETGRRREGGAGGTGDGKRRDKRRRTGGETATGEGDDEKG